jgi:hypothetical protein
VPVSERPTTPLSLALDLFVFAPLGAAIRARELVPELAEVGRQHVELNLNNYRAVGELAVGQLRRQARGREQPRSAATAAPRAAAVVTVPVAAAQRSTPSEATVVGAAGVGQGAAGAAQGGLPIHDYDELSAVQVLPRLSDLRAAELRAVADYEASHRGRETILGRIDQLLGPRP